MARLATPFHHGRVNRSPQKPLVLSPMRVVALDAAPPDLVTKMETFQLVFLPMTGKTEGRGLLTQKPLECRSMGFMTPQASLPHGWMLHRILANRLMTREAQLPHGGFEKLLLRRRMGKMAILAFPFFRRRMNHLRLELRHYLVMTRQT